MARTIFSFEQESFNKLAELITGIDGDTEQAINEVLWEEGGKLINDAIINLLPVSNRQWKGKKKSAKFAQPFTQKNDNLSVTIRTKNAYNYLYFPDDGTNTRKHAGERYFMIGGAEIEQNEILDRCIAKITEKFNL